MSFNDEQIKAIEVDSSKTDILTERLLNKNFNDEQLKAINVDNGKNCLIAAAAGSGKTAVLSERVVRLLTSADEPAEVNEIIVATFTTASATEMIHRISGNLTEEIDELKNLLLKEKDKEKAQIIQIKIEQYELKKLQLANARISTINSLCKNLVQENFQSLDISSSTRIVDQTEIALQENNVIIELLDELHTSPSSIVPQDDFHKLVEK